MELKKLSISIQRVSNIALPQAQHKATSPTRKTFP